MQDCNKPMKFSKTKRKYAHRWLTRGIRPETIQQAAEEVHETDWQVDIRGGHHFLAVAPHEGHAWVHQPLKQSINLHTL